MITPNMKVQMTRASCENRGYEGFPPSGTVRSVKGDWALITWSQGALAGYTTETHITLLEPRDEP